MVAATKKLDAVFNALADPTRRAIVSRLARGSRTVGQLAEPFDMSLPAISKHLKVLEGAGLITRRIEGRVHHCHLNAAPMGQASEWINKYRTFWEQQLDSLDRYLKQKRDDKSKQDWNKKKKSTTRTKKERP